MAAALWCGAPQSYRGLQCRLRTCEPAPDWCSLRWWLKAKLSSIACTTSIAVTKASSKSCRQLALKLSASTFRQINCNQICHELQNDTAEHSANIRGCVFPAETVLDFEFSSFLWSTARRNGYVLVPSVGFRRPP